MKKQANKVYVLADVVMRMVVRADGRLTLHPRAAQGFRMALDALFAHDTLDPKVEIEAVLRLCSLFERDRAFELAGEILDLLARDERALAALGIGSVKRSRDAKKKFAALVGAQKPAQLAPVFGTSAPAGSVKLSTFLDPGRQVRRRPQPPTHLARAR